jgi:hypothetical protein
LNLTDQYFATFGSINFSPRSAIHTNRIVVRAQKSNTYWSRHSSCALFAFEMLVALPNRCPEDLNNINHACNIEFPRVEEGSNSSTVALESLKVMKRETVPVKHDWANVSLVDTVNTGCP